MNISRDTVAFTAANSVASDSSFMRTPVAATGTTVFLREEGSTTFVPVYHQSSVTLRDLAEEFSISSVLECDAHGNVQPRAVAFDSPSDILHSGRHYIARRDARAEPGSSYVTFKGKISVKEYELEHPTPPTSSSEKRMSTIKGSGSGDAPADLNRRKPAATPFADKHRKQESLTTHEAYFVAHAKEGETPTPQRASDEEEEEATISRALALSSERKRPREDSAAVTREGRPERSQNGDDNREGAVPDGRHCVTECGTSSVASPTRQDGGVLYDRTNSSFASPNSATKMQSMLPVDEVPACEVTSLQASAAPTVPQASAAAPPTQPQKQTLRFIPFTETAADGTETYVTLESLQLLCSEATTQEEDFHKKHRAATDILESARRALFLNDGVE